ncbi:hypothetical protein BaRGS_00014764 [Batillaria attramentaria]|uniref:Uncharacterized protein n=1 Tax=Batillaria attramentaria TaxID=370345 RepID=A0ABD0L3H3_9CAEN
MKALEPYTTSRTTSLCQVCSDMCSAFNGIERDSLCENQTSTLSGSKLVTKKLDTAADGDSENETSALMARAANEACQMPGSPGINRIGGFENALRAHHQGLDPEMSGNGAGSCVSTLANVPRIHALECKEPPLKKNQTTWGEERS